MHSVEEGRFRELLDAAFGEEYNDVFLYLREAEAFRRKLVSGERLGGLFREFSVMELRHADRIAAKILELGGRPQWTFSPIEPVASLHETLGKHRDREARAVQRYRELAELARGTDFAVILKGIREEEREHGETIARTLEKLGPRGTGKERRHS